MPERAKLTITAELPQEFVALFLQHVRDFDVIHQGCHFSIAATTNLSTAEMEKAIASVQPPFKYRRVYRKH